MRGICASARAASAGQASAGDTLNASMILSGMGPVDPLRSDGAKVFASCYALFSGVVFISTAAILVAPGLHRVMHRLHMESEGEGGG